MNTEKPPDNAIKAAETLLRLRPGKANETKVENEIITILNACEIEMERQFRAGSGRIDFYLPRRRVVIETKRPGHVPADHREQVERYIQELIKRKRRELPLQDEPRLKWIGIVTDGCSWGAWSYFPDSGLLSEQLNDEHGFTSAHSLLSWLLPLLQRKPVGKRWIPADPRDLFMPWLERLRPIYSRLSGDRRAHTDTKKDLWLDMLRTSSMEPARDADRERLFQSHSFLVALARAVAGTVSSPRKKPSLKEWLGDGFVSWIIHSTIGRQWAEAFLDKVRSYDWSRPGDVLRPLYENIVDEKDRKAFGEFYTPDWLAEMMVAEVLDDEWCEHAINAALKTDPGALNGVGILDPTCGSGTFLYFAVDRILNSTAMEKLKLNPGRQSSVVARLVNGIDVHPVAAEMARATVMRALHNAPAEGMNALQIYEGDALLVEKRDTLFFTHREGTLLFTSPKNRSFTLPDSLLERPDFAETVRRLVETAYCGDEVPSDILESTSATDRAVILEAHKVLVDIIKHEGNSVWTWFIVNMAGPYQLSNRKVDRIIANPPWVSMAGIQAKTRKRALESFAQDERVSGIWSGGKNAPHFDIAQLFVKRSRELYLSDATKNPAAWLVKLAALTSGGWKAFREKYAAGIVKQSLDLTAAQPFGGGDARRCCILFEGRSARIWSGLTEMPRLIARLRDTRRRPRRPKPHMLWEEAQVLLRFEAAPEPFPKESSGYDLSRFRQGATITPKVLTLVDTLTTSHYNPNLWTVKTQKSAKSPWREIGAMTGDFPKSWIKNTLKSQGLLPFAIHPSMDKTIIPVNSRGTDLLEDPVSVSESWREFDETYREQMGLGASTPKSLVDRINYNSGLSYQLEFGATGKVQVVYPTSADVMRAARMATGNAVIDSSVYWFIADSPSEAAYLVGVLNAPVLTDAFAESRTSGRAIHKNPWRAVPVPVFDPNQELHRRIADVSVRAEEMSQEFLTSAENRGGAKSGSHFKTNQGNVDAQGHYVRARWPDAHTLATPHAEGVLKSESDCRIMDCCW